MNLPLARDAQRRTGHLIMTRCPQGLQPRSCIAHEVREGSACLLSHDPIADIVKSWHSLIRSTQMDPTSIQPSPDWTNLQSNAIKR